MLPLTNACKTPNEKTAERIPPPDSASPVEGNSSFCSCLRFLRHADSEARSAVTKAISSCLLKYAPLAAAAVIHVPETFFGRAQFICSSCNDISVRGHKLSHRE